MYEKKITKWSQYIIIRSIRNSSDSDHGTKRKIYRTTTSPPSCSLPSRSRSCLLRHLGIYLALKTPLQSNFCNPNTSDENIFILIPHKKNETNKGLPAFTFSPVKPRESEIIVQKLSESISMTAVHPLISNDAEAKSETNSPITNRHPHSEAKRLILSIL